MSRLYPSRHVLLILCVPTLISSALPLEGQYQGSSRKGVSTRAAQPPRTIPQIGDELPVAHDTLFLYPDREKLFLSPHFTLQPFKSLSPHLSWLIAMNH